VNSFLHQAGSVADAAAAFASTGVQSVLLIDVVASAPKRMVLQDAWRANLAALAAAAAPLSRAVASSSSSASSSRS
jgi:hypothetical protein